MGILNNIGKNLSSRLATIAVILSIFGVITTLLFIYNPSLINKNNDEVYLKVKL